MEEENSDEKVSIDIHNLHNAQQPYLMMPIEGHQANHTGYLVENNDQHIHQAPSQPVYNAVTPLKKTECKSTDLLPLQAHHPEHVRSALDGLQEF
mmetsp:Transcript_47371/g.62687  ORF Transcript_47371/g.62687 Transcript_47371/m.62687 type:complete len:95 (+) Transcript_47371:694-978(+)